MAHRTGKRNARAELRQLIGDAIDLRSEYAYYTRRPHEASYLLSRLPILQAAGAVDHGDAAAAHAALMQLRRGVGAFKQIVARARRAFERRSWS